MGFYLEIGAPPGEDTPTIEQTEAVLFEFPALERNVYEDGPYTGQVICVLF